MRMKIHTQIRWSALVSVAFVLAACSPATQTKRPTALLVKSTDKGATWQAKTRLVAANGVGSIAGANVTSLAFDPSDTSAIYATTQNRGLLYSYDGGENWFSPRQVTGNVTSVAVDPNDKCTIYVATSARVLKSTDCNRSFSEMWVDPRPKTVVTAVAVHPLASATVYYATNSGEIVQSTTAGASWATLNRFGKSVDALLIDEQQPDIMYAAVPATGIFRSIDRGVTWENISDGLKSFGGTKDFRGLYLSPSELDTVYLVNGYGIIKTADGGSTWTAVNLITPPKSTKIFVMAVSPTNGNEITYGTANQLYRTVNGGETWSFRQKLPVTAQPSALVVDPNNANIYYLASRIVQTQ